MEMNNFSLPPSLTPLGDENITLEHTISPLSADINFLTTKINQETPEFGGAYPFAFFLKKDTGEIIAGCNGLIVFGSIYTDQLWVDPSYHSQGFARYLMEHVHDYGRKIGCTMATLATMSFQGAQGFYEKLGYQAEVKWSGYVKDSICIMLRKYL